MGFFGKYRHTLDPKGRVFVPKKILAALPEGEPRHFIVNKGFEGCLMLYTTSAWRRTVEQVTAKDHGEREKRDFRRLMFASASQLPIDNAGRILIPEDLRQEAGLDREVVFLGLEDQIEVWDLVRWNQYEAEVKPAFESSGRGML